MIRKHALPLCLPAAAILASPAVLAAPVSTSVLDEINVTATRVEENSQEVPAAIGVVNQQDIQLGSQQLGLDESLVKIPGITMMNRYNFAQDLRVSIRGFGARSAFGIRGVKILVDGIPETLPDGQGSVDGIDIGSTESMEVYRGPVSALYGNASGGAIVINTEQPPETAFVELRPSVGDDGFQKTQLKFGNSGEKLGYLFNLSDMHYDGYREHSEAEAQQLNGKLNYEINSRAKLSLSLNHTDSPTSNDPGGINATQMAADPTQARDLNVSYNAGEALTQTRLGLVYDRDIGDNASLMARTYYLDRDFENYLPFEAGGAVAFQRSFAGAGLQYTRNHLIGRHSNRFTLGLDYDRQTDDRQRYDNLQGVRGDLTLEQEEQVTSTGVFLQNEFDVNDKLQLTAGVRADSIEFNVTDAYLSDGNDSGKLTFDEVSPTFGLLYKADERVHVYANVSTSFETPTTTELANPNGGGFNAELTSQTAVNYEIGAKNQIGDNSRYEIAFFRVDVEGELLPYELEDQPDREFYQNAGESRRQGVEFLLASEFKPGLMGTLAYTYSDFEFTRFVDGDTDYSGKAIPGIPEQQVHADLTYSHNSGVYANLDLLYSDEVYANNANSATANSYTVANLKFGYTRIEGNWEFSPFIGINNLTDERYAGNVRINAFGSRYYEPAPDRNVYAGFGLRYDYGM